MIRWFTVEMLVMLVLIIGMHTATAQEELAKESQNPLGNIINLIVR